VRRELLARLDLVEGRLARDLHLTKRECMGAKHGLGCACEAVISTLLGHLGIVRQYRDEVENGWDRPTVEER
jgi:hypothetical protein